MSSNVVGSLQIAGRLPNLEMLILQDNPIADVKVLEDLRGCPNLKYLSLIDCPITRTAEYRLKVIRAIPQLKVLDFQRITATERKQALLPDAELNETNRPSKRSKKAMDENKVKEALKNVKTLEDVKQLEKILATGHVPSS